MDISRFREQLEKIIEAMKRETGSIRTGRATPALVEDLEVDYYGSKTPLKAIASISSPEPRSLVIQPWDKAAIPAIEKAIQASSLGLAPIAEKDIIRLSIPSLTEERRRDLIKLLGKHLEYARIEVRKAREDALRSLERMEKEKHIGEDEKFRNKQELQKIVEQANKHIEDAGAAKEKEIMG